MPTKTKTAAKATPKPAAKKEKVAPALASLEMPAAFREIAETGVMQAKEAYDTYRSMAEEATDAIEDTFSTINKGATDMQAKALYAAKANVNAGFDFVEKMLGVKSLSDLIAINTEFARKQFDALTTQAKEMQDLASKVQADSVKPLKDGVSKAMGQWKTAF